MTSPHPKHIGLGSPRKRPESVTPSNRIKPLETGQGHPETRNRAQSNTNIQQPSGTRSDPAERVFPIRSVVSVDPTITPQYSGSAHSRDAVSPTREGARQYPFIDERTWNQIQSQVSSDNLHHPDPEPSEPIVPIDIARHATHVIDDKTELATHSLASDVIQHPEIYAKAAPGDNQSGSGSTAHPSSHTQHSNAADHDHVTARFKHVMTDNGHAVITGRDGEAFQYCEDEPIRIPGAIQSFGLMIVLREESPNQLVVRIVSENSAEIVGYSPKQLFELKNFCDILSEEQADNLLDHVDFVRDDAHDPSVDGPDVFNISICTAGGESRKFWCATHVSQTQKDMIICEFELEDDRVNPLNVEGLETPAVPIDTLGIVPTADQLAGSTINISQPLRVLRNARRRKGEASSMEAFSILTQIQEQLGRTNDLDQLLNTTAGLVKELTGFHRVLIYQFDSRWNGMVVAELVDPNAAIDLYKGLHFPASDIPAQARELYKINKVRLLYDRDQVTSRLVCRTLEDLESPLDMTHAYLRAMSPIHVKYLAHMKVRSSMSISVNAFNDLWGLISCHSYGTAGMRVSFPIRKMCRLLGDTVSRNIERLSYASRLQARKLINTVPTEANPAGYIIASSDDLLQLFDADYGVLSIRDETKILGDNNNSQEVLALIEFLRVRQLDTVLASRDIVKDFPDLHYAPGLKAISGLLYVPLSTGGRDFIAFFRRGHLTEIKWAGNPYEIEKRKQTAGYLEPRESFTAWRETVLSQSREWTESDVETAAVLCLVYGKFIKVWRQKEAAMQNSQLTRLLLANSAHEVRTPLNAIVNYLEIALEGALDDETRESLTKSHSASKSLIYVINDLLDLTNTEKGQDLIKDESFDLESTFREAADMLSGDAKRKNISYTVSVHPGIPQSVVGDQRRVRQVISNVISNAIQHTKSGAVTTEMYRSATQSIPGHMGVEIVVTLFNELEQVSTDETYYPEEENNTQNAPQKRVLGLGLALAARIVHNMHGQLAVRSEEGKGSHFRIILQFRLPEGTAMDEDTDEISPKRPGGPTTPLLSEKEFTLVPGAHESSDNRRRSTESLRSGGSGGSGQSGRSGRSHADRLISAMQEAPLKRSNSQDLDLRRLNFSSSTASASSHHAASPFGSPSAVKRSFPAHDLHSSPSSVTHTPPMTLQPLVTPPPPGLENITDSGVPMSALRMSQHSASLRSPQIKHTKEDSSYFPRVLSVAETSQGSSGPASSAVPTTEPSTTDYDGLDVLVAEDDPINSKIIHKRLTKLGHTVKLTGNGEACVIAFSSATKSFDVVLMDIQMPILDGMAATRAIREFESKTPKEALSDKAIRNDRVPIFAVSASLVKKDLETYIDTGFDGWVMKPINFARLNVILSGICDPSARQAATYTPEGEWENGGWFNTK
ncbi:CheY-like superfamily [Penicillium robsamsonii]|uniref:CheY-like superfamily n=1 Tax=Penicillium robsamsonii TaxID=1792511 RepID=UPI002548F249|nr:CheY-like superfamily [Penicillium robsamsonii]KAJ5823815.1 CheY-like superfamily [Penicillium robsamsonii]